MPIYLDINDSIASLSPLTLSSDTKILTPVEDLHFFTPVKKINTIDVITTSNDLKLNHKPNINPKLNLTTIVDKSSYDLGVGDDSYEQMKIINYFHFKFLDEHLFKKSKFLLKFFKVRNDKVVLLKSKNEIKNNDIDNNTSKENELIADYIEDNYLSKKITRKILQKILNNFKLKPQELNNNESYVRKVMTKYLKKQLSKK